jgi:predicted Fe-S protein YdhL (DUF1289 family)
MAVDRPDRKRSGFFFSSPGSGKPGCARFVRRHRLAIEARLGIMSTPMTTIPSPCVRNCSLDERDICLGCYRSLSEICRWADASDEEKKEILANCLTRGEERRRNTSR